MPEPVKEPTPSPSPGTYNYPFLMPVLSKKKTMFYITTKNAFRYIKLYKFTAKIDLVQFKYQ